MSSLHVSTFKAETILNHFLSLSVFILLFHGVGTSAQGDVAHIGAIIDVNSRIGKQEKISMEIATQAFNDTSSNRHKLVLHVSDSGGDPLQAFTAAEELTKEKQVQAIIGMRTWKEASLVTEVANRAQVPVLSFSAPSITPPLASVRWPFLVRMASSESQQIQCVASLVGFYGWRRVIGIYEDEGYNSDRGTMSLLSDALGALNVEDCTDTQENMFFFQQHFIKHLHLQIETAIIAVLDSKTCSLIKIDNFSNRLERT